MKSKLAIVEAAPFAVDLAAAISELGRLSENRSRSSARPTGSGSREKAPVSQKAFERLDELV
jgi:hypothetical protein